MTIINDRTSNRSYALPNGANDLGDDVVRLRATLAAIDTDMASVLAGLAGKAALLHTHSIADVAGLQAALNGKMDAGGVTGYAPIASPNFTGTPTAPTPDTSANSSQIANTAWVQARLAGKANVSHTHAISDVTNLVTTLAGKADSANLAAVAFNGAYSSLVGRPVLGNSSSRDVGTTTGTVAAGDDARFDQSSKAPLASPSFTGTPTAPTPANGDNSTRLATTAFVLANVSVPTTLGAVGTYLWAAYNTNFGGIASGATTSGANLSPTVTGTWRLMSISTESGAGTMAYLFMRIA